MEFRFDITLTEEAYLDFNKFHTLESATGKKSVRRGKLTVLAVILACTLLELVVIGWNEEFFGFFVVMVLLGISSFCFFNKLGLLILKFQIKQIKKTGKLPFDVQTTYEFYEDKLVLKVPDGRMEQSYDGLERVCVVPERFLLIYRNSSQAFVLPIPQIRQQGDLDTLVQFLAQKCGAVERY